MAKKYMFITGGVTSSLGKGLSAACLGSLLEMRGINVTIAKMDPYLNVDPGTMNPFQHGEVFVTDDGAETDLDLGHYERFISTKLSEKNSFSAGQVYDQVINNERKGHYLGATVQVIPHITDEIKRRIKLAAESVDLAIIEVGGTVGDIEGLPFFEAIRQFRADVGPENVCYVHLSFVPYLQAAGELKTKPTQHSVKMLQSIGIQPDIILCRCEQEIGEQLKQKIGLFCNLPAANVFTARDVDSIYTLPISYHEEGIDQRIVEVLNIWTGTPNLSPWQHIVDTLSHPRDEVHIGIVGKYTELKESYKSLNEALVHGGIGNKAKVNLVYLESEKFESDSSALEQELKKVHAILVPGGFGDRGVEGKMKAIEFARKNSIPFFGICLGLQLAVIEFARNVVGHLDATSTEFEPHSKTNIIDPMAEQKNIDKLGGTMRLGAYECQIQENSRAFDAYKSQMISERHRHRFEVNNKFRKDLEEKGLSIVGINPERDLVEIVEIKNHPWFVAVQFHPEFKSQPMNPHPLFSAFVKAAIEYKKENT